MIFAPSNNKKYRTNIPPIKIGNTEIGRVPEFKYLGVILDHNLNFESHVKMIRQKTICRMQTLRKIRWTLTTKDALTLYKSSILPHLDQGDLFYSCANTKTLQSLQSMQNKALRIIYTKKTWDNTQAAHTKSKLLYLEHRRRGSLLKYAHKLSYNPDNLKNAPSRLLRSSGKTYLKTTAAKTSKFERSFTHQGVKLWNQLSDDLKAIRNYKLFKTRIMRELLLGNLNFPE